MLAPFSAQTGSLFRASAMASNRLKVPNTGRSVVMSVPFSVAQPGLQDLVGVLAERRARRRAGSRPDARLAADHRIEDRRDGVVIAAEGLVDQVPGPEVGMFEHLSRRED